LSDLESFGIHQSLALGPCGFRAFKENAGGGVGTEGPALAQVRPLRSGATDLASAQSGELISSGGQVQNRQLVPFGTVDLAPRFPFELVELPNKCSVGHMKRVEAKIEENRKEDSAS
jgi:hypothetical protein